VTENEPHPPASNQQKHEPLDETGEQKRAPSAAPPGDGGVPTPGDSQGVSVPSVQAAAGTSEEDGKVDGVSTTALAAPGKPDGEVDTRT
jgi:hypothetical protein